MPQVNFKRSRSLVMLDQERQLLLFDCTSSKQNDEFLCVQRHGLVLCSFAAVSTGIARD